MTDQLTTERLREIAGSPGNGVLLTYTNLERSVCAELLAKREECEALSHRAEDAENQLRCVTLTGDAVASDSSLYCGNSVRYWYDKANAYKDSAGKLCEARKERDAARAERDRYHDALVARHGGEPIALLSELDEARATLDDVCKALGADVDSAVPQALMFKEKAGEAEKLRAELDAVKRQRDELLASSEPVADALRDIAGDGHRAYLDAYESAVASILAASQPAQQPKPEGGAS